MIRYLIIILIFTLTSCESDNEVTDQNIAGNDSEVTDQNIAGNDSEVTDQNIAGNDSEVTDQNIAGNDSEVTGQNIAGNDSEVTDQNIAGNDNQNTGVISNVCGVPIGEFVQVIVSNVNAGEVTFEAFRITSDNSISSAKWDRRTGLIGISELVSSRSDEYDDVRNTVNNIALTERPDDGTLGQPGGDGYTIAMTSSSGIRAFSGTIGAEPLMPLIERWRLQAPLITTHTGFFYWSYPIGGGDEPWVINTLDIEIETLGCENALSQALINGVSSPEVVLPAPDALVNYFESVSRTSFNATSPDTRIRFGPVLPR